MIPYTIDPSLHQAQPALETLEDGFSPPAAVPQGQLVQTPDPEHPEAMLGTQSAF